MTCEETLEWLDAYLDGEVAGERRAALEAHLPSCPGCAAELRQLGRLHGLLDQELGAATVGGRASFERLWARCASLDRPPARRIGRRGWRRVAVPVAAGALAAGAALAVSWWLGAGPVAGPAEPRLAGVEAPADLRRRAELFVDYAIVRHLDELEHLDLVLDGSTPAGERGGRAS